MTEELLHPGVEQRAGTRGGGRGLERRREETGAHDEACLSEEGTDGKTEPRGFGSAGCPAEVVEGGPHTGHEPGLNKERGHKRSREGKVHRNGRGPRRYSGSDRWPTRLRDGARWRGESERDVGAAGRPGGGESGSEGSPLLAAGGRDVVADPGGRNALSRGGPSGADVELRVKAKGAFEPAVGPARKGLGDEARAFAPGFDTGEAQGGADDERGQRLAAGGRLLGAPRGGGAGGRGVGGHGGERGE